LSTLPVNPSVNPSIAEVAGFDARDIRGRRPDKVMLLGVGDVLLGVALPNFGIRGRRPADDVARLVFGANGADIPDPNISIRRRSADDIAFGADSVNGAGVAIPIKSPVLPSYAPRVPFLVASTAHFFR
jgi:hypothetical protein